MKINLQENAEKLDWRDPRRNVFFNLAFNWDRNYKLESDLQGKVDEMLLFQKMVEDEDRLHQEKVLRSFRDFFD
jgi:hypothetical protein